MFGGVGMKCYKCGEHEAIPTAEEALSHNLRQTWCECCLLRAQLDWIRHDIARIPELEARLATACSGLSMALALDLQ